MSSECLIEESRGHFDSVEYQRQLQRGVDEESS
jgi:hypothetical protein